MLFHSILIVTWHYDPHLTGEKIKIQKSFKKLFKIIHTVEQGFKLQTINHWQEFTPCWLSDSPLAAQLPLFAIERTPLSTDGTFIGIEGELVPGYPWTQNPEIWWVDWITLWFSWQIRGHYFSSTGLEYMQKAPPGNTPWRSSPSNKSVSPRCSPFCFNLF